jgi:hypothetical protein
MFILLILTALFLAAFMGFMVGAMMAFKLETKPVYVPIRKGSNVIELKAYRHV